MGNEASSLLKELEIEGLRQNIKKVVMVIGMLKSKTRNYGTVANNIENL